MTPKQKAKEIADNTCLGGRSWDKLFTEVTAALSEAAATARREALVEAEFIVSEDARVSRVELETPEVLPEVHRKDIAPKPILEARLETAEEIMKAIRALQESK